MMNEKEKFIVRITCEPKIEPLGDFSTKIADKISTLRVEKVNESVISQLRDLMRVKGINELYVIDENKVLEMVKKSQAFDIIKQYIHIHCIAPNDYGGVRIWFTEDGKHYIDMPQEEYDLLKEVRLCH